MGEKIVVGPISKGLRTDVTPFNIDNDSFPTLINAYQWRGRVKRKRGTSLLGRLKRFFNSTSTAYSATSSFALVAGAGNILVNASWTLETNGNIVPGSVTITNLTIAQTYTDAAMNGTLSGNLGGTGTINYATGAITITGGAGNSVSASFNYYPDLPVMGLEDFVRPTNAFPGTIAFDTTYSYNINIAFPYSIYDVSFYKNPATGAYPGYVQKTTETPVTWNGNDYQQFWTVNYEGALWATNGVAVPFDNTIVGMQFKPITGIAIIAGGPPATATITIIGHGLVVGDFVFINEVGGTTGINFQTGYVITVTDANNVIVEFPNATLGGAYTAGGIAQYLTNRSDTSRDCLRFYDGDPTDSNATTPSLTGHKGWVNFCPPISQSNFSIDDLTADQYYLVGAKMIVPFKDRLLFIGPVVQTSDTPANPIYLQDTVVYSQNGTSYYTASFTGTVNSPATVFNPILVPDNETAAASAYFSDQTGFGGFITAGIDQPINTAALNLDVLIMGFTTIQTQFVYTGNDIIPFNFFIVNSDLGSDSTFSAVTTNEGVLSKGSRGYIVANQRGAERIDLVIPDQVFETRLVDNGIQRVCSQRDFINEWIYFTYPSNKTPHKFPTQTLQFNYRDNSWSLFNECYTTYGSFRKQTGFTWATVGTVFPTWSVWNQPWSAGSSTLLQPEVIGGNQQGFVMVRDDGTDEGNSLYIQSFSSNVVTSPDHCLNDGDYITISGAIGAISTQVNGKIFSVGNVSQNTFTLSPSITPAAYVGGGVIKRMYVPYIQTRQFPIAWALGRKTRIGPQQYLLSTTDDAQITLLIFLSEDGSNPYNDGPIVPSNNVQNNALIYSTVLYTCPESTNLGLTPANVNLQTPTAANQDQIWHRINTSLIGDTVQIGFTMSDEQMRTVDDDGNPISQFAEIEIHSMILDVTPSQMLV